MKKITACLIAACLLFSGCAKKKTRYEAEFLLLFDTVTQIVAYSYDKEEFEAFTQKAYGLLNEYHELYDIYNDYDGIRNLKTINDNAGLSAVTVDRRIIDLLLFSKEAYQIGGGSLNVAMGAVLRIWHGYREAGINAPENAALPPMEKLLRASEHTDIENLIIDEENRTVYLADPGMSLDVGAVAKGYAAERVAAELKAAGYDSFLLSVGGNVRAVGAKNTGGSGASPWNIGIDNPDPTGAPAPILNLAIADLSVVTSGDYQRYYTVGGKRYHHIIDPKTLMPAAYVTAVTVVCEDSGMADALSTILYNLPIAEGKALVESLERTEALWILPDGSMEYSSGLRRYIIK